MRLPNLFALAAEPRVDVFQARCHASRSAVAWRRVAIANDRAASLLADRAEDMLRQLDAVGRRLQFFDLR